MFEDYYLHKYPTVYPENFVLQQVKELKCNFGMRFHINKYELMNMNDDYIEYLRKKMATNFGLHALEEGKFTFKSWDDPIIDGRTMEAETFIFTKKEIFDLLGRFGIQIDKNPTLEK